MSSFPCHSSLLTVKSVDLVVVPDGFLKSLIFFIVVTLIAKELFEQLFICTALNMKPLSVTDTSVFR